MRTYIVTYDVSNPDVNARPMMEMKAMVDADGYTMGENVPLVQFVREIGRKTIVPDARRPSQTEEVVEYAFPFCVHVDRIVSIEDVTVDVIGDLLDEVAAETEDAPVSVADFAGSDDTLETADAPA